MKTGLDSAGESDEFLLSDLIDRHTDLGRSICRLLISGMVLSIILMILLYFSRQPSASPRRIAKGVLTGLWLGAYLAQWLWAASRLARGECLTGTAPGLLRMWWLFVLLLTGPLSFVKAVLHWRRLTRELWRSGPHDGVQRYLADQAPHTALWLAIAGTLYLGGSIVLVYLMTTNRGG